MERSACSPHYFWAMAFKGWPAEAIEFFEGLEADNSKTYWQDHKAVYDEAVKGPMEALLLDLSGEFGEGKVFRPYRDIRFSADKSPYKTNIAATLSRGGYISLSATGLGAGTGMYTLAPDQLERYREAVANDRSGGALAGLVAAVGKKGIEVSAQGLPQRPPPHRTAPSKGAHHLEAMAGELLARHEPGQAANRRLLARLQADQRLAEQARR